MRQVDIWDLNMLSILSAYTVGTIRAYSYLQVLTNY